VSERKFAKGVDMSFQFSRESDQFGTGCGESDSRMSNTMKMMHSSGRIAEFKARALKPAARDPTDLAGENERPPANLEESVAAYAEGHNPKHENPMYATTSNDIGCKPVSVATLTNERLTMSQYFTNSFQSIKYRDQGLNTSLSRSRCHSSLDPAFL
jgi:hypothetical protein